LVFSLAVSVGVVDAYEEGGRGKQGEGLRVLIWGRNKEKG
jgi:hypothetical protein